MAQGMWKIYQRAKSLLDTRPAPVSGPAYFTHRCIHCTRMVCAVPNSTCDDCLANNAPSTPTEFCARYQADTLLDDSFKEGSSYASLYEKLYKRSPP